MGETLNGNAAANAPTVRPPDNTWVNVEQQWLYWQGKTEKPVPVPLCPPKTPLDWPVREPAVRSQRISAWATARP
jgi:hypothetical protein